jgi:hypothetical protein
MTRSAGGVAVCWPWPARGDPPGLETDPISAPFLKGSTRTGDAVGGVAGGTAPALRLGAPIELPRGDLCRVLDPGMVGEALAGEGVVPEQAPPRFL